LTLKVDWRRDDRPAEHTRTARHQGNVRDLTAAEGQVKPLLDHVGVPVTHDQLNGKARMAGEQYRETSREE
jgi:hypothetical protein